MKGAERKGFFRECLKKIVNITIFCKKSIKHPKRGRAREGAGVSLRIRRVGKIFDFSSRFGRFSKLGTFWEALKRRFDDFQPG